MPQGGRSAPGPRVCMLWGALHPRKQSTNFCVFVDICIFLERDHAPPESHQWTCDPERLDVAAVGVKNTAGMAPKERDSQQKAEARPAQGRAPMSEQLCPPPRARDPLRRAAHGAEGEGRTPHPGLPSVSLTQTQALLRVTSTPRPEPYRHVPLSQSDPLSSTALCGPRRASPLPAWGLPQSPDLLAPPRSATGPSDTLWPMSVPAARCVRPTRCL